MFAPKSANANDVALPMPRAAPVTTLIDALGIVIYLTVARAVLDVSPAAHGDHAAQAAMAAAAAASNVVEDVELVTEPDL